MCLWRVNLLLLVISYVLCKGDVRVSKASLVIIAQSSDGISELFLNERVLEPGSALAIVSQGLGFS